MNKLLMACCLIFISFVSYSQYSWVNPKPSGFNNTKVHFISVDTGFVLNSIGELFKTVDAGQSWSRFYNVSSPASMSIQGRTILIAPISGAVRISFDAGNTWVSKNRDNTAGPVDLCQALSTDTLFLASTNSGKIMRSYNGGNSWQTFSCGRSISSFYFVNATIGYIGSLSSYILKTTDGGATWQTSFYQGVAPSNTSSIYFFDENKGIAYREYNTLLKTTDGGATWTAHSNFPGDVTSIFFLNNLVGYMSADYGKVYKTIDGGNTWQNAHPSNSNYSETSLFSTFFTDQDHGYAVGMRGIIYKTNNGGASWQQYGAHYNSYSDLNFASDSVVYATWGESLMKSTDAGNSWQPLTNDQYYQPGPYGLIHFFNKDTGFVTSGVNQGWIFKTYNGGATWKYVHAVNTGYNYPNSLDFVNDQVGYHSVGSSSFAHSRTVDGGETWKVINPYSNIRKFEFVDAATGYGWTDERMYKTIDSGKTWTLLSTEQAYIKSIYFNDLKNGFMVGESGIAKRTIDSGKTWTSMQIPNLQYADLGSIKFYDGKTGFLTSESGTIYKTSDSGKTWTSFASTPMEYPIIRFGNAVVYFAGGWGGLVKSSLASVGVGGVSYSNLTDSSVNVFALINSFYANADSIRFEYGVAPALDQWIAAAPASISNQSVRVSASITGLLANTQYLVRAKIYYNGSYITSFSPTTFTTPVKYVVAPGTPGSCESYTPVTINGTNNNEWVSLKDAHGNAVADINANGNDLGNVVASVYIEDGAVRDTSGFYFLDRNISIQVQNQPVTPVSIRLYILKAEYDKLSQLPAAGIANISMLKIHKNNTTCTGDIGAGFTELTTTAAPWGNDYVLTAQVNSFSSFYFSKANVTLPVRLVNFHARRNNKQVALSWQTQAESNTSHFEILRSRDGVNFETIGKITSAGQSNGLRNYSFTDNSPIEGSNYYKLKIVDKDQHLEYSKVVYIDMQSAASVSLLQNPVKDHVELNSSHQFKEIQLINVQGKLVKKFVPSASNVYSVQGMQPGVYYLRCISSTETVVLKFVKQ